MYIIEPITATKTTIAPNIANSGGIPESGEKQNVNIKPPPIPPSNVTRIVTITFSGILMHHLQNLIIDSLLKVHYIKGKKMKQPNANKTQHNLTIEANCGKIPLEKFVVHREFYFGR